MFTEQLKEPVTLNKAVENFSSEIDIDVTLAHSAGEECSAGQEGHEAADSENRILTCKEVSTGVYKWVDTGRVRS